MRAIAVHGGAGDVRKGHQTEHRNGARDAMAAGRDVLLQGGCAVDAVVAAVTALEDNPVFNAGYGAVLNQDGKVELDAGLMDGTTLEIGAVAALSGVANPIQVCRFLLHHTSILFAKEDALRWAAKAEIPLLDPAALVTPRRYRQWLEANAGAHGDAGVDTVGAVAVDQHGRMAAATSTGGISGKPPGRIGDSPLPGCGYYADSKIGACSATGWGESIARVLLSARAIANLERGEFVSDAAIHAVERLGRVPGGSGGLILLTPGGGFGFAKNTASLTRAWWCEDGAQGVAV